ncbi:helix-turn-helix transcriptional regulator [Pelosinus sp. IPA-1]|uniref:helix-turn-helix domain-containing protein n=1 Tax=Pelosinus sp. IPA-1 TaxID=3029569 RepID=UPI0024361A65|nr:helix-turn-helix transcriptional regulator [Pelosinus sp. IPA-1]GMB02274.1 putative HTH-type transcriptional regulator [Pelosinus sp. IPA-1]
MRTWNDVRGKIKSISQEEKDEIKLSAKLVGQLITRREELGISQRQLSIRSGLQQASIARLEKYNAIPRIDTFARLSKSLGLEIQLVATNPSKE